jgi:hypothetical protein
MSVKTKNQSVKLSNVVVLDEAKLKAIAEGEVKFDNRTNNPGRPVNKQSARYKRLAKQAFYSKVNKLFVSGKSFKIKENQPQEYHYSKNSNGDGGCLFNGVGHYVCNINYVGRTKVTGFTYVLNKRVNVELNLKQVQFVK